MAFALKSKQLSSLLPKIFLRVAVALLDSPPELANELHRKPFLSLPHRISCRPETQTLPNLMIYLILALNISENQIPTQKCQDK